MSAYTLEYETSTGRCAWCWEPLPPAESHAVVSARRPPHLVIHLHNACWITYKELSGIELGPVGIEGDWTPAKIETLRVGAGMTVRIFAKQLGVSESRFRRILTGDVAALGPGVRQRLRKLATVTRHVREGIIDWSDPRAFFCLRMHLKLGIRAMAEAIGCSDQQVSIWDKRGVPQRSVRTWSRLSKLADARQFDVGMIVDDRLWTAEFLDATVRRSGRSNHDWGVAMGYSAGAVQQWRSGTRPIVREAAWALTRAAYRFNQELPPIGEVKLRKGQWAADRKPLSAEDEAKRLAALREAKWTLADLRKLGTMPDRVLARELDRSRNSVAIMRRNLDLPAIDVRYWDGVVAPQLICDEEIGRRWDIVKAQFKAKNADATKSMSKES